MAKAIRDLDRGYTRVLKALVEFKSQEIAVGLQVGDKTKDGKMDVAMLAAIQHFGGEWDVTRTHYKKLSKSGNKYLSKGRFVKKSKANYSESFTGKLTIPARPFLSDAFDSYNKDWNNKALSQVGLVIDGKKDTQTALSTIGNVMERDIKKQIASGDFTPNSPATVRQKGSARPLIDTGRMRQSIRYIVRKRRIGRK